MSDKTDQPDALPVELSSQETASGNSVWTRPTQALDKASRRPSYDSSVKLSRLRTGNVYLRLGAVDVVELVQNRLRQTLLPEDVRLEPPGEVLADLVFHVGTCWHSEDVVKFFECALLRLRKPQEARNGQ